MFTFTENGLTFEARGHVTVSCGMLTVTIAGLDLAHELARTDTVYVDCDVEPDFNEAIGEGLVVVWSDTAITIAFTDKAMAVSKVVSRDGRVEVFLPGRIGAALINMMRHIP